MSNFTKIRQHFTTTAVIGGACLLIFIVSLSALYRHSYQSSIPEPWMEPSYSSRSSHHKGPAGLVDRLLILLPKDRATKSDYGFHEDWLEKAIDNRKRYADFHGGSFYQSTDLSWSLTGCNRIQLHVGESRDLPRVQNPSTVVQDWYVLAASPASEELR